MNVQQPGARVEAVSGRSAALAALADWAARRTTLEAERPLLVAAAWNAGARTVAELARTAEISRDTVYSDLGQQGIDYTKKDADPRLTRLAQAVARLAQQFRAGHSFTGETVAGLGPALAEASAYTVSLQGLELVGAVEKILATTLHSDDQERLAPFLDELLGALDAYRAPVVVPAGSVRRGRASGPA